MTWIINTMICRSKLSHWNTRIILRLICSLTIVNRNLSIVWVEQWMLTICKFLALEVSVAKIRARMTLRSLWKIRISLSTLVTKLMGRLNHPGTNLSKLDRLSIQNSKSITTININKIRVMQMINTSQIRNHWRSIYKIRIR